MAQALDASGKTVRQFRQILLWPLQMMPVNQDAQIQRHWELLEQGGNNPWRELADEFTSDAGQFKERHYSEFVTFLPFVQRFLYGDGRSSASKARSIGSPMRVYRRDDISALRVLLHPDGEAVTLSVAHIDLYFFYDIDVVILNVEVHGENLPLRLVQDLLYRSGRAYPGSWEDDGHGTHCAHRVEWLSASGEVLATSDFENREKYLSFVCRHRTPCISSHWSFLLKPMMLDSSEGQGALRYRQVEFHRMPVMAYLAMDNPHSLSRADFIRLGLNTASGADESLPYAECHVAEFEKRYCYDRHWGDSCEGPSTRFMCSGNTLVVVGDANHSLFTGKETGVLAQFRHQHFLLFLIAHMQRAALLMFSNRLVEALDHLEIHDAESVKGFKRSIRANFEIFLRFTHRYWFHELSDQALVRSLYRLCTGHLETDALYDDVKKEIYDMSQYLDSDSIRRQANTVVRLTVVTTFGLIGTVVSGIFGMNLFGFSEKPLLVQWVLVMLGLAGITGLTLYTLAKSKRLSDFLDAVSDERLSGSAKFEALVDVWRRRRKFE